MNASTTLVRTLVIVQTQLEVTAAIVSRVLKERTAKMVKEFLFSFVGYQCLLTISITIFL